MVKSTKFVRDYLRCKSKLGFQNFWLKIMYNTLLYMKAQNNILGLRPVEQPPSPHTGLEHLMEDLESLGLRPLEHPLPRIGTSHGGLRKFRFEACRTPVLGD